MLDWFQGQGRARAHPRLADDVGGGGEARVSSEPDRAVERQAVERLVGVFLDGASGAQARWGA